MFIRSKERLDMVAVEVIDKETGLSMIGYQENPVFLQVLNKENIMLIFEDFSLELFRKSFTLWNYSGQQITTVETDERVYCIFHEEDQNKRFYEALRLFTKGKKVTPEACLRRCNNSLFSPIVNKVIMCLALAYLASSTTSILHLGAAITYLVLTGVGLRNYILKKPTNFLRIETVAGITSLFILAYPMLYELNKYLLTLF